jgi:nitrogen regulatory protein P-II 1
MKKVDAIIRPEMVPIVRKAVEPLGVTGITISQVMGHGAQKGITQQWKGSTYTVDLLPKVKLEMVIMDSLLEPLLKVIQEAAFTGAVGDGKVFVTEVFDVMRVRTGERGEVAI